MKLLIIFCTLFLLSKVISSSDEIGYYYKILNLEPGANISQVKRAFKVLMLKYHPDKVENNDENKRIFLEISKAYEILGDPEKKAIYDNEGIKGLSKNNNLFKNKNEEDLDEIYENFFKSGQNNINDDEDEGYFTNSEVIRLDMNNINSHLKKRAHTWIILIYNTNIENIEKLVFEWRKLASYSSGIFKVGYTSCRDSNAICTKYNVNKYKILVFKEKYESFSEFQEYDNTIEDLNYKDIFQFASNDELSYVKIINKANFSNFFNEMNFNENKSKILKRKVLLLTTKSYIPILYKRLSKNYSSLFDFGICFINEDSIPFNKELKKIFLKQNNKVQPNFSVLTFFSLNNSFSKIFYTNNNKNINFSQAVRLLVKSKTFYS